MTANQNTFKKTVRVTIEKEIAIELMPSMFGDFTEEQFINQWRKGLWEIKGIDDVVKFAACMAAIYGEGTHDGIGFLAYDHTTIPRVPDVKFNVINEDVETEILP